MCSTLMNCLTSNICVGTFIVFYIRYFLSGCEGYKQSCFEFVLLIQHVLIALISFLGFCNDFKVPHFKLGKKKNPTLFLTMFSCNVSNSPSAVLN